MPAWGYFRVQGWGREFIIYADKRQFYYGDLVKDKCLLRKIWGMFCMELYEKIADIESREDLKKFISLLRKGLNMNKANW